MKFRIVFFSLLAVVAIFFVSVHDKTLDRPDEYITVCSGPDQFAGFASNRLFMNLHPNPEPVQDYTPKGEMITYAVETGNPANAYFIKSNKKSNDYLFVVHEWWGLNEHIKKEADRLYQELGNINVIALDIYDGQVATTRENASKYMQSVTEERARAIIAGANKLAGKKAKIFTIGWCFGGGWSLQTGIEVGDQAAGSVMFYGMPEKNVERLKTLNCDVLGIFASQEKWITPEVVSQFEADMKEAGKSLSVKSYDAAHGFANPSNPLFDKDATEDSNKLVIEFIQKRR